MIAAVVTIWLIAVFRPQRCGPSRAGDIECTSNHTIESGFLYSLSEIADFLSKLFARFSLSVFSGEEAHAFRLRLKAESPHWRNNWQK